MAEEMPGWEEADFVEWGRRQAELAQAPGTPEWARSVELSPRWRPFKRLGELAAYGSMFHTRKVGMSFIPQYLTRGDLVRAAEVHQVATQLLDSLGGLQGAVDALNQTLQEAVEQEDPRAE